MKRQPLAFVLVLLLLSVSTSAHAGWTQPKGDGYAKFWIAFLAGSHAFDTTGELVPVDPFIITHSNVYSEFGLHDDWTLVGTARPLGFARYGDNAALYAGPFEVGVRRALLRDRVPLALEGRLGATFPSPGGNLAESDDDVVFNPTEPSTSASLELQIGYGFDPGWVRAGAGVRYYFSSFLDPAAFAAFQIGTTFFDNLTTGLHLAWHQPFGHISVTNVTGEGQTAFLGFGLSAGWWFTTAWGLTIGVDGAAFARSNAGSIVAQLGVEHQF